jgi:hypothetical protein
MFWGGTSRVSTGGFGCGARRLEQADPPPRVYLGRDGAREALRCSAYPLGEALLAIAHDEVCHLLDERVVPVLEVRLRRERQRWQVELVRWLRRLGWDKRCFCRRQNLELRIRPRAIGGCWFFGSIGPVAAGRGHRSRLRRLFGSVRLRVLGEACQLETAQTKPLSGVHTVGEPNESP